MMSQTGVNLASINQQINIQIASSVNRRGSKPIRTLIDGPVDDYRKFGLPLYEASVTGDWSTAKAILHKNPELVRYSITENGESALHVIASAKPVRGRANFVKFMVDKMEKDDLSRENDDSKTALFFAAEAGNIDVARIIVKKNRDLLTTPDADGELPLYIAAFHGNSEVAEYLYAHSKELSDDDGWNPEKRSRLLDQCVEGDMFGIALKIVHKYPELGSGNVLESLARKPGAFMEQKFINIVRRIVRGELSLLGLPRRCYERESEALSILKIICGYIVKKPKSEFDRILRGASCSMRENLTSEKVVQVLQLQNLISAHLDKLDAETQNITRGQPAINDDQLALQLQKLISEHLVNIHVETKNIISVDEALALQKLIISEQIVSMHVNTQNIIMGKEDDDDRVLNLKKLISEHIRQMRVPKLPIQLEETRVLFIAAQMGNTKFLRELIRQYPELVWKVNDKNQTIFHVAIIHRHEDIYNMLFDLGSTKNLICSIRDRDDNNMLHLAGKSATKERLSYVNGAALQMNRELLWFKEVQKTVPVSFRKLKNKDGFTPSELFTKTHKELITDAEKWLKNTATQCMVVAALIATIALGAAFTIPGGYSESGIPIFYHKRIFVAFVVADAISFFLSSASILAFLSIIISRYAENDFVEALPRNLMIGLGTLYYSVGSMVITFLISFFILYDKKMKWIPIFLSFFAYSLVAYTSGIYGLVFELTRSTYSSRYLFHRRTKFIYYRNIPRV